MFLGLNAPSRKWEKAARPFPLGETCKFMDLADRVWQNQFAGLFMDGVNRNTPTIPAHSIFSSFSEIARRVIIILITVPLSTFLCRWEHARLLMPANELQTRPPCYSHIGHWAIESMNWSRLAEFIYKKAIAPLCARQSKSRGYDQLLDNSRNFRRWYTTEFLFVLSLPHPSLSLSLLLWDPLRLLDLQWWSVLEREFLVTSRETQRNLIVWEPSFYFYPSCRYVTDVVATTTVFPQVDRSG